MPKIAPVARSSEYTKLATEAIAVGERNDCTVKAVALVAGVSYDIAHAAMTLAGRREKQGAKRYATINALVALGKKVERRYPPNFINRYPGAHSQLRSITTHHPDRFKQVWADGRTYLFFTSGHVAAIINGTNHDWTRGRAMRVAELYEVL